MNSRKRRILESLLLAALCVAAFYGIRTNQVVIHFGMFAGSNWDAPDDNTNKIVEKAIEKFEQRYPGVQIEYESGIPKEDYSEWLMEKYLTGTEPDVFFVSAEDFSKLASRDALLKLGPYIQKDTSFEPQNYYRAALATGTYQNVQYGLPFEAVPLLMCVNETLLLKEGIKLPENNWTWGDFHAICRRVTKDRDKNGELDQFGVANYDWKDAAYANGAVLFDENGTQNYLGDNKVVNAVNFVYRLDSLTDGYTVTEKDFEEGKVAFMPMLLSDYRTYHSYPYCVEKYTDFNWDCISMPAGPQGDNSSKLSTMLGVISDRSDHTELSWNFLKMLTYDMEIQTRVARESKGSSSIQSIVENYDVYEENGQKTRELMTFGMDKAIAVPEFYNYDEIMKKMEDGVTEVMSSDKKIEVQMMSLERELNQYMN